jgi:hypothetical protein
MSNDRFPPIADIAYVSHQKPMTEPYRYTGNKAGAIASGFFVAGCTFIILYFATVYFVVAPEGRPDDVDRAGRAFWLVVFGAAILAALLGWQTKRFFDRRAGRR